MADRSESAFRSPRAWLALGLLAAAYFLIDSLESGVYHVLAHFLGVHRSPPHTLRQSSYGLLMSVRLFWDIVLWFAICAVLGHKPTHFPIGDRYRRKNLAAGLVTGLIVMLFVMCGIWFLHSATVVPTTQTMASAFGNGVLWMLLDFVGAFGEELYGRAVVLLVAERFLGWRGAVLVSGLMFSGLHLSNPGATWIWLVRLFVQGALLAYATFRTGSLWWSSGYHTGWNWISAPLFGAIGSGYLDESHIFTFVPNGSIWLTGGSAGPEGSVLAFVAVLMAFALLLLATKRPENIKL